MIQAIKLRQTGFIDDKCACLCGSENVTVVSAVDIDNGGAGGCAYDDDGMIDDKSPVPNEQAPRGGGGGGSPLTEKTGHLTY